MVSVKHIRYKGKKRLPPVYRPTEPYSYIIFKKGSKYYAKNGETREVEYEGYDASEVIQSCVDALPNGGAILLRFGRYNLYNKITLKEGILLKGEYAGSGAYAGSPRTLLVNYFDDHVIEMEAGSGIENVHIAKGVDPFTHSFLHITECDFNKPILISHVFGSSDLFSDGDFILLEITKNANICGVFGIGLRWYGFENGIHLLGNPEYTGNVISGNIFIFMGRFSRVFVKMERNGGGYQTGNKFIGIMQCGSGTERAVLIDGNANEFHISSFDIPSGNYDVEVLNGARGNIVSGWVTSVLNNGERTKIISPYHFENSGTVTITGDGTTTTFTVDIPHGLAKDKVVCKITLDRDGPIDKVYLVDTEPDGFYETIRVQVTYASAPASGEEVPIYWSAEVVE